MDTAPLDDDLLDAVLRLVRLCDSPETIEVLAPLIQREIIFRLLIGGQGDRVRQIAAMGEGSRIAEAIVRMRRDFAEPLRIEALAADLGMSVSSFHHRFKEATAMSPLQFHKQLRLQEARRLMLGEQLDATTAGSRVGYADMAYFNRDYKRLFGAPPIRDVHRLRQTSTETAAVNI
ncbi:MAG: helix-turn-helix domain-containing protein [Thermomicrobiales bacterium]